MAENAKHLLLVDDEAALREAIAERLADHGFVVEQASNGEDALARLADFAYDIIVTDLRLPGVDGRAVLESALERYPDIIAIIITVMVLEMKVPHGERLVDLKPVLQVFLTYVLSFLYVGIYWNNHHHMFQATKRVSGGILWGNLHLLFWLSLFPFATGWMGENHLAATPTAVSATAPSTSPPLPPRLAHGRAAFRPSRNWRKA